MSSVPNATAASAANNVDAANSAPVEQKQPVVAPVDGQSTLAPAQPTESRGFFGTIYDGVASVFTWIKDKFVAIYNWIFGSCSSASEVKPAEATQLEKLGAQFDRFGQYIQNFKVEGWKEVFNAMPKEDQDLLIREDMRAIAKGKDVAKEDRAEYIESRLKVQENIEHSLKFVRDLENDNTFVAADEVPNYLDSIAESIGDEIAALKAQEEKK